MPIALVENGQRVKKKKSQGVNVESDQEDKKTVSSKVKKPCRVTQPSKKGILKKPQKREGRKDDKEPCWHPKK